ncbi:ShlB/FhaC/HecB family hemolysin secretion/activation protein [[Haemophilus] felis]|nr:ShlB/FhaC/HecB family hemolysin secretion/activation protein [[Haemophilus] felis]
MKNCLTLRSLPLFLSCSATFLLTYPNSTFSANQTNPPTQEDATLARELLHLKNKQQFDEVDKNFKKANKFLAPSQENHQQQIKPTDNTISTRKITCVSVDIGSEKVTLDFSRVINDYQGKALSTQVVFQLVKDLTDVLYRAGYVTSAIGLKNHKIQNGDLQFVVLWGRVSDVLVEGKVPENFKDKAMISVLPTLKGKLLNIYDIDQLVEILNTTNKNAKVNVVAADTQGSSHLNIERKRTYFPEVGFGLNNSGTESNANGRNQATLNISLSDVLGTNDQWHFSTGYRLYKQNKANQQQNYALSYSQPFSFSTLDVKLSQSQYEKAVKGVNGTYASSGKTQTLGLKLTNVLSRNQNSILSAYGELEFKKRVSYFADIQTGNYRNNKANIGLSYVTNFAQGKLYADISYTNGLRWFGANYSAYDDKREKTLKLLSGSVNWQRLISLFKRSMNYQLRIGGQYGFDSLYSENQFSIGDEYTVRGFKGGAASGDSGVYLSQTITVPFYPQKPYLSQISLLAGLDVGQVYVRKTHKSDTLAGIALGVKAQVKSLSLSFTYGQPLKGANDVENNRQPVYYFNGSISF